MRFLCRRDEGPAAAWWAAVGEYAHGAPGIARELLLSRSVACDPTEAEQALAWAQDGPAMIAVAVEHTDRLRRQVEAWPLGFSLNVAARLRRARSLGSVDTGTARGEDL